MLANSSIFSSEHQFCPYYQILANAHGNSLELQILNTKPTPSEVNIILQRDHNYPTVCYQQLENGRLPTSWFLKAFQQDLQSTIFL